MPTSKTTITSNRIDHPINVYFYEEFLRRVMPRLVHEQFGKSYSIPMHSGDTAKWRRYTLPVAQTTPMSETDDPNPVLMAKTDLTATARMYGAWIRPTTWLDMTGLNADKQERTRWLADQYAITIDTLCRAVISGTASGATCSNGVGTATYLNRTDVDTAVRTLANQLAEMIMGPIKASTGQGTSPIRDSYVAIAHTALMHDIENKISGFKHTANYSSAVDLYKGEWGSTGNVRWLLTTNGYVSSGTYTIPIMGQEAYGNVKMPGIEDLMIFHPPKTAGSALELYSTYGWKAPYACKILNDNWIYGLSCTASS